MDSNKLNQFFDPLHSRWVQPTRCERRSFFADQGSQAAQSFMTIEHSDPAALSLTLRLRSQRNAGAPRDQRFER